jgi:hypothetical protein
MAARFISTRPNFASRAPLARPSLLARLYRSCQEELLFGDACSEAVACPHEQYCQPPDMTQIVPRGGERVRAERPPHGQSEPRAFECGQVPCSPASSQPRRPAFGGEAVQECLGNSHHAARPCPGLRAASVVSESAPCRASVASVRAMPLTPLRRGHRSQDGVWPVSFSSWLRRLRSNLQETDMLEPPCGGTQR